MSFSQILEALKEGKSAARKSWESMQASITLVGGTIAWKSKDHPEQVWAALHGDLLAEDWFIIG